MTLIPEIRDALHRNASRNSPQLPLDYPAMNARFRRQKAELTRAINSGDPERVQRTVVKHVREWNQPPFNGVWPDFWARWQNALDDVLPLHSRVLLEDIR